MPSVQVLYYTDPACPWSWALEPTLRRLVHELGQSLRFRYVMCGMAREFAQPAAAASLTANSPEAQVREALEAAAAGNMPVDPRLWFEDAPASSFPACIAVKAAAEQGDPARYLRRLREGFMCFRRRLDTSHALLEEARAVGAIDIERFRIDLGSHAILEAFGADLERAKAPPAEHHAPGSDRVQLPSLEFCGADGEVHGVYGFASYEQLREAALAAGAESRGTAAPSVEDALRRFGSMASAEVAAVCDLPGPRAPAELWRLAVEWRARPQRVLAGGELWAPA